MKYLKKYENIILDRKKDTIKRYKSAMNIMNKEETIDYIINHCSDWLNNPVKIIRGINNKIKYFQSDPVMRFSVDNANYYTIIMDNSPSWKNYPKRTNSFTCSLEKKHIGKYEYCYSRG